MANEENKAKNTPEIKNLYLKLENLSLLQKTTLILTTAVVFTLIGLSAGRRFIERNASPQNGTQDDKNVVIQGKIIERRGDLAPLPKLMLQTDKGVYELLGERNIELSDLINERVEIKGVLVNDSDNEEKLEVLEFNPVEKPEEKVEELTGTIQPIFSEIDNKGTHILLDEDGQILAYLKTNDDKLAISEGAFAQIEGKLIEKGDDSPPLIQVEKIIFK